MSNLSPNLPVTVLGEEDAMVRNARIARWIPHLVVALVLPCGGAGAATGVPAAAPVPIRTHSEAAVRANAYTGFPVSTAVTVSRQQVTDPSAPVADVRARSVWEVTFENVSLKKTNPNIRSMRAWIDAQTGALVKAFTPKPADDGLRSFVGPLVRVRLSQCGMTWRTTWITPPKPLATVLPLVGDSRLRGSILQAREIVAYFALLTRPPGVEEKVVDRPVWVLLLGGINQPAPSQGPIGGPGVGPVTEALVLLDAETGQWYWVAETGRLITTK